MTTYTCCDIVRVGISSGPEGGVLMQLKDIKTNAFDWTWCSYTGPQSKEVLATGLAALTSGLLVMVDLEFAGAKPVDWQTAIKSISAARRDTLGW